MTIQNQSIMTSRNFKLGAEEIDLLRGLCDRWGVSQSEAVRRAVRLAASDAAGPLVEPEAEAVPGDDVITLFEMLDARLDYVCLDISKLATRIDHLAERLPPLGDVTYGVVSLEDVSVSPACSCAESSSGKKRKKKSKKGKKGTR